MINDAAAELGRRRWKGTTKAERSEAMRALNETRWSKMTEEERKAHGAMLAAARAKARRRKKAK